MQQILEIYKKSGELHHAYLIAGDIETNLKELEGLAAHVLGCEPRGSIDYFLLKTSNFVVADSNTLVERSKTLSFGGGKRLFVVAAHSFTDEAQNKLLKLLEEPLPKSHFFVLSEAGGIFLPTLLSRLFIISGAPVSDNDSQIFAQKLFDVSVTTRVSMIEKFVKDGGDESEKALKQQTRTILDELEKIVAGKILDGLAVYEKKYLSVATEIIRLKGYLNDSAPSPKLILEYLAFIL